MNKLTNKELLRLISDRFEKNYVYWAIKWVDKSLPKKLWFDIGHIREFDNCTIITWYCFRACYISRTYDFINYVKEDDVSYFVCKTLLNNPSQKNYA